MKNLIFITFLILSACTSNAPSESTAIVENKTKAKGRVLFIVSNAHYYGNSEITTSNHFAEIVLPYNVLKNAGYVIDFMSPEGGAIPIGYIETADPLMKKYLYDNEFMDLLEFTKKPDAVDPSQYQAVYYGGGGSAMFGVPENEKIQEIAMNVYEEQDGIISAVCHGTAGLVNLKTKNGKYLVDGKKVNGFPDLFENKEAEYYKQFPFSIQETINERGGTFNFSEEGWDGYFEVDGKLITGQDPSAAGIVANKIIEALEKNNHKS